VSEPTTKQLGSDDISENGHGKAEATQAPVFMVVSINESWKIPAGYFFIHSITSTQRAELVKLCLTMLFECGVKVTNLTFDGASENFAMPQLLGSSLDAYNMNPEIILNRQICTYFA
jgi:hypothetical protein